MPDTKATDDVCEARHRRARSTARVPSACPWYRARRLGRWILKSLESCSRLNVTLAVEEPLGYLKGWFTDSSIAREYLMRSAFIFACVDTVFAELDSGFELPSIFKRDNQGVRFGVRSAGFLTLREANMHARAARANQGLALQVASSSIARLKNHSVR